jgi:hypothetical protein
MYIFCFCFCFFCVNGIKNKTRDVVQIKKEKGYQKRDQNYVLKAKSSRMQQYLTVWWKSDETENWRTFQKAHPFIKFRQKFIFKMQQMTSKGGIHYLQIFINDLEFTFLQSNYLLQIVPISRMKFNRDSRFLKQLSFHFKNVFSQHSWLHVFPFQCM